MLSSALGSYRLHRFFFKWEEMTVEGGNKNPEIQCNNNDNKQCPESLSIVLKYVYSWIGFDNCG